MSISALNQFATQHAFGKQQVAGKLPIPEGSNPEKELPQLLDGLIQSLTADKIEVDLESPTAGMVRDLALQASTLSDPQDSDKFQMGYQVIPTKVEADPNNPKFLAIDMNPMDLRWTSESPVYPESTTRVFVDTTSNSGQLDYLIAY